MKNIQFFICLKTFQTFPSPQIFFPCIHHSSFPSWIYLNDVPLKIKCKLVRKFLLLYEHKREEKKSKENEKWYTIWQIDSDSWKLPDTECRGKKFHSSHSVQCYWIVAFWVLSTFKNLFFCVCMLWNVFNKVIPI